MTADVVVCSVPLPRPIRLGATAIEAREYCVLRITTEGAIVGTALGYTRGLRVADALERAAAALVGRAIGEDEASEPRPGAVEIRIRGLSEIALLDARARSAEQPLWRLLGGAKPRVPLLAVGGYFMDSRSLEDVATELQRLAAAGFKRVKVHATERAAIEHLRHAVGAAARLSVDLHGACGTLEEALDLCLPLDDLDLDFVEDPFPLDRRHLLGELAGRLHTRLAAGEDVPGASALRDLIPGVSILRVDAK
jgi:L-alanine-DL-glutamate epimerase-like enolase superfamily enzyme